jgi:CheY-like chemotaxis protein
LISDIELPDADGYFLIRSIRSIADDNLSKLPAIALTAHSGAEDRVRALAAGFQMHVTKPVEPIELVLAIANLTIRNREAG